MTNHHYNRRHIRAAFLDAIEAYESWEQDEPEPTVPLGEEAVIISRIAGLAWNDTGRMPVLYVGAIADHQSWAESPLRQGATYAQGARVLLPLIRSAR